MKVRLVDEKGKSVKPGTQGEIQVKGPAVFAEYWGKPGATMESFRKGSVNHLFFERSSKCFIYVKTCSPYLIRLLFI